MTTAAKTSSKKAELGPSSIHPAKQTSRRGSSSTTAKITTSRSTASPAPTQTSAPDPPNGDKPPNATALRPGPRFGRSSTNTPSPSLPLCDSTFPTGTAMTTTRSSSTASSSPTLTSPLRTNNDATFHGFSGQSDFHEPPQIRRSLPSLGLLSGQYSVFFEVPEGFALLTIKR